MVRMPFKQASDIFHLTGIDQEETILLLFPDAVDPKDREILFVRETSEHIAIWEGAKFTPAGSDGPQRHRHGAVDEQLRGHDQAAGAAVRAPGT
jgi:hypothetical protein